MTDTNFNMLFIPILYWIFNEIGNQNYFFRTMVPAFVISNYIQYIYDDNHILKSFTKVVLILIVCHYIPHILNKFKFLRTILDIFLIHIFIVSQSSIPIEVRIYLLRKFLTILLIQYTISKTILILNKTQNSIKFEPYESSFRHIVLCAYLAFNYLVFNHIIFHFIYGIAQTILFVKIYKPFFNSYCKLLLACYLILNFAMAVVFANMLNLLSLVLSYWFLTLIEFLIIKT